MSGKRCSRSRANSVSGCPDDQGAGVGDINPDFRALESMKSDDGRRTGREENADGGAAETERETEEESTKPLQTRAGDTDRGRDPGNWRTQEPMKEATKPSHVPGGAWLSKTRPSIFASQARSWKRDKGTN
ncbi:hypothetical protein NDU88_007592 [Pleurodeles waltl]|uniref:Uncharacterized protein n=1 Tax=Pleurodeles waltl TaxID=8319 RepID=A0AAV7VSR5_PLEWA|nr:hypothetical protein NDU88_007592 [Pleurodeles waltl]